MEEENVVAVESDSTMLAKRGQIFALFETMKSHNPIYLKSLPVPQVSSTKSASGTIFIKLLAFLLVSIVGQYP